MIASDARRLARMTKLDDSDVDPAPGESMASVKPTGPAPTISTRFDCRLFEAIVIVAAGRRAI
jgi:hypothetical protein